MKKLAKKNIALFFIAILLVLFTTEYVVVASEVTNEVGITFTKGDKGPIKPELNNGETSGKPSKLSSSNEGSLPQTGVHVHKWLIFIGFVISLISIRFIYNKKERMNLKKMIL